MTKESPPPPLKFSDALQALAHVGQNVSRFIEHAVDAFRKAAPGILSLMDAVRRMPEVLQNAIIHLANEGWYLDWKGMSLQEPAELAQAYLEGRHQEVEDRLVEHYRRRLPEIEEELAALIPARAHIFRQIFAAHRQGHYYATVPTLLSQADGVCLEELGTHFFMKKKGKGVEHSVKLEELDALTKAMLAPFFWSTNIRASSNERTEGFDGLNRHLVLHGESLDYGTEVRSLQSISFLNYVAVSLVGMLDREIQTRVEHLAQKRDSIAADDDTGIDQSKKLP